MKKISSFWLYVIYFSIMLISFILINTLLFDYQFLFVINVVLTLFFSILGFFLVYVLSILPLKSLNKIINHYTNQEFLAKNYDIYTKDYVIINRDLNILAANYKQLKDKYEDVERENQTYYEQYQIDLDNKKQLVASISHEIKTPLAVIEATASGLLDKIFPEEDEDKELANIITECDKTSQMLQEIVNIYKLDSKNYNLEAKSVNLAELVEEIIADYHNLSNKYEKEINVLNDLNYDYLLNYNQIRKALENIILNAILYSPKGENITISLNDKTDYKVLEIINYGITIDKNHLKRIFEPFYRVDESRTKKEDHGNGLGLYIVKQILDKHKLDYGIVNVDNGVKFYIIFNNSILC